MLRRWLKHLLDGTLTLGAEICYTIKHIIMYCIFCSSEHIEVIQNKLMQVYYESAHVPFVG